MKAIRITEYGGPEVLRLAETDTAEPGPGQARIKNAAAGLNYIDVYQRVGKYPVPLPFTPGHEGAGTVEAVGANVTNVKPGDRVAYLSPLGSYAESVVADAGTILPLPDNLTFEQGAAIPLQGLTAHYLLHDFRRIEPSETVLIHAAAGGMGLLLVQWAKHLGARVIGTTSTEEKANLARQFGADDVILYTQQDFAAETKRLTNGEGAHLIIDGVGKTTFAGNFEAAAMRGNIVLYGSASGTPDAFDPGVMGGKSLTLSAGSLFNFMRPDETPRRVHDLMTGLSEGWLKLHIDRVLPLAEASEAHRLLEGRQSVGKLVLKTN